MKKKLSRPFYEREEVTDVSVDLLGKYLFSSINGVITGGIIVETEGYSGRGDKACHAHLQRRTKRTETMFCRGGIAYVYLCYGIHHMLNVVTHRKNFADAVLIRAIEPVVGMDAMMERRNLERMSSRLTAGPGMLTQALGITTGLDRTDLQSDVIWIEDRNTDKKDWEIIAGPRVGVGYAGEDANLPWRFSIKGNPWVSKANPSY